MNDAAPTAIERIEQALVRIEQAAAERAFAADRLAQRHDRLRGRVEEALTALDALIDQDRQKLQQLAKDSPNEGDA